MVCIFVMWEEGKEGGLYLRNVRGGEGRRFVSS